MGSNKWPLRTFSWSWKAGGWDARKWLWSKPLWCLVPLGKWLDHPASACPPVRGELSQKVLSTWSFSERTLSSRAWSSAGGFSACGAGRGALWMPHPIPAHPFHHFWAKPLLPFGFCLAAEPLVCTCWDHRCQEFIATRAALAKTRPLWGVWDSTWETFLVPWGVTSSVGPCLTSLPF